jgi:hypothetical protein
LGSWYFPRYERRGLLVEEPALEQAEQQCLADEEAITLAVVASVRHEDTEYDALLMSGVSREDARDRIRAAVDRILTAWA